MDAKRDYQRQYMRRRRATPPVSPALLATKPLRSLTEPLININELHWRAGIAVIFSCVPHYYNKKFDANSYRRKKSS